MQERVIVQITSINYIQQNHWIKKKEAVEYTTACCLVDMPYFLQWLTAFLAAKEFRHAQYVEELWSSDHFEEADSSLT